VPAGQGILWSVGPDGQDDGGSERGQDRPLQEQQRRLYHLDWIYLVPIPADKAAPR